MAGRSACVVCMVVRMNMFDLVCQHCNKCVVCGVWCVAMSKISPQGRHVSLFVGQNRIAVTDQVGGCLGGCGGTGNVTRCHPV